MVARNSTLKIQGLSVEFLLREWLLTASGVALVLTSVYTSQLPTYSLGEMEVLFILFALFVAVQGLQQSGIIARLSQRIERGGLLPLKLVVATFFLSMFVTNDVALIVIVPLTLALDFKHKDILVILEALAANAGSALTPFGNPQNLYIYWFYDLTPLQFIASMAPFSLVFLGLLIVATFAIRAESTEFNRASTRQVERSAYVHGVLLVAVLLSVLRVLPVWTGLLVMFYALLFDRRALRVDYALLISLFFFFGLAENIKTILATEIEHSEHIFLFSALASQVMSNVPAALLFTKFTTQWNALLWGTNAGGFGSLFGSIANLIAYKLYVAHDNTDDAVRFTIRFLVIGYVAFFAACALYFALHAGP